MLVVYKDYITDTPLVLMLNVKEERALEYRNILLDHIDGSL